MNLAHVCRARTLEGRGGGGGRYARFITLEHIRRGISDLETSSSSLLSFFSFFRGEESAFQPTCLDGSAGIRR